MYINFEGSLGLVVFYILGALGAIIGLSRLRLTVRKCGNSRTTKRNQNKKGC